MGERRKPVALPPAFLGLMLCGCGAEAGVMVLTVGPGPDRGGVVVALAPAAATFDDEQARLAAEADGASGSGTPASQLWQLRIDGQWAMRDGGDGHLSAVTVAEGGQSAPGYLDAGPHHFTVATPAGASIFDGDADVPSGGTLRLFLYGPREALQGRFVPTPDTPASGNEHVTVVNLVRTGPGLEVVTCSDAASCAPISPVLGLGDLFDTEVPAPPGDADSTLTGDGAGIGYRVTPSNELPAPPVLPLHAAAGAAVFVAAPIYMTDQGTLLGGFN